MPLSTPLSSPKSEDVTTPNTITFPVNPEQFEMGSLAYYVAIGDTDKIKESPITQRDLSHLYTLNVEVNSFDVTLLHIAAANGHAEAVTALIEKGANVNQAGNWGGTPLLMAAQEGHAQTANLLIERGANVNQANVFGNTPLIEAAFNGHTKTANLLIERGAYVNQAGNWGVTPLLVAAQKGHTETAILLIDGGANVNQADKKGYTPLIEAAFNGHTKTASLLIERDANVNQTDNEKLAPLHFAAQEGHTKIANLLIVGGADVNQADIHGNTPLIEAAFDGHTKTANLLIQRGANINQEDFYGNTPLIEAAFNGHAETANLLIDRGANINHADKKGQSSLCLAAQKGHTETANLLIERRANINQADIYGNTPLHDAALNGHTETANLLIERGADINQTDNEGVTPLIGVAFHGYTEIANLLIAGNADVNQADNAGFAPLHFAAQEGHTEIANLLIAGGADVNRAANEGQTAIITAFETGHFDVVRLLQGHGALLPEHLQDEVNRLNPRQSVHEVTIHASVSRSARNLLEKYNPDAAFIKNNLAEMKSWLEHGLKQATNIPDDYNEQWLEPATKCFDRLSKASFTDLRSSITMKQALALVWVGTNNVDAFEGRAKPREVECLDRRVTLLKNLYEIQRGYNLNGDSANPTDNKEQEDEPTCISGSFNKLIAALDSVGHPGVQIIFVTKNTISEKAQRLTQDAFNELTDQKKSYFANGWESNESKDIHGEYFSLIKSSVKQKLHEEFEEFSIEIQGGSDNAISEAILSIKYVNMTERMKAYQAEAARSAPAPALLFSQGRADGFVEDPKASSKCTPSKRMLGAPDASADKDLEQPPSKKPRHDS